MMSMGIVKSGSDDIRVELGKNDVNNVVEGSLNDKMFLGT